MMHRIFHHKPAAEAHAGTGRRLVGLVLSAVLLFSTAIGLASMIDETPQEYRINTGSIVVTITKSTGTIKSCQLAAVPFECACDYRGYSPLFPEFCVTFVDGRPDIFYTPYLRGSTETVIRYSDDDIAIIDATWHTDYFRTWWAYTFLNGQPYFKVYLEQEVLTSGVYSNHQQCAMLSPDMNDTYLVGYEGELVATMRDNVYEAGNMLEHSLYSAIDQGQSTRLPMFAWHNDEHDVAAGIITTYVSPNQRETMSYHGGGSTKQHPGFSEVEWNWFGKSDMESLYLREGLRYGMELLYVFMDGDLDRLDAFNRTLLRQSLYHLEESEDYWAASWGGRRGATQSPEANNWNFPQASSNFICSQELYQPRAISIPRSQNGTRDSHLFDLYCKEISDSAEVDLTPVSGYKVSHVDAGIDQDGNCYTGSMTWNETGLKHTLEYRVCSGSDRLNVSGQITLQGKRPVGQLCVDLLFSQRVREVLRLDENVYDIRSDDSVFGTVGMALYGVEGIKAVEKSESALRLIVFDGSGDSELSEGTAWRYAFRLYPHVGFDVSSSEEIPETPSISERHFRLHYRQLIDEGSQFLFAIKPDPHVTVIQAQFGEDSVNIATLSLFVDPGRRQLCFFTNQADRIVSIRKDGASLEEHEWSVDPTTQVVAVDTDWNGRATLEFIERSDTGMCHVLSLEAISVVDGVFVSWTMDPGCGNAICNVFRACEPNRQFVQIASGIDGEPPCGFFDGTVEPGQTYSYIIETTSGGSAQIYGPVTVYAGPEASMLLPCYPNPFNAETAIPYLSHRTEEVRIAVYNLLGRRIKVLHAGNAEAGQHLLKWDGRDDSGVELPNGVYICTLETLDRFFTQKMVLLK